MKQSWRAKGEPANASIQLRNLPMGTTEDTLLDDLSSINVRVTGTTIISSQ